MIPLGKAITRVTRVARRFAGELYRYVIYSKHGRAYNHFLCSSLGHSVRYFHFSRFGLDTYVPMHTPGFSSKTSVRGLYCFVSINPERENITSMTTYSNNNALKPPFFFLLVMRVSRKLEYNDCRV